ncbi:uncharacterized protein [Oryza sativa Japonica Group]|uniref:uncharacterized protein n=1 Tax=Oryza sativa subsp. japonica TaxID=39947 RepID=UPI0007753AA0|nr:uncharacterized protein LOC107277565 [Oryza sativa Japonica Group]
MAVFQVGDGKDTDFWRENWLPRGCISVSSPTLFTYLGRSKLTVVEALRQHRWVRDIRGSLSAAALSEYLNLWDEIQEVQLQDDVDDSIRWRLTSNGTFCTASVYELFFAAQGLGFSENMDWNILSPTWGRQLGVRRLVDEGQKLFSDEIQGCF